MNTGQKIRPLIPVGTPIKDIPKVLNHQFKLMARSKSTLHKLLSAKEASTRQRLYVELCQINDEMGIPTESAQQLLGADAPPLLGQEGGAA